MPANTIRGLHRDRGRSGPDSSLGQKRPRYTSYPTADRFIGAFTADSYTHWLTQRNIGGITRPLSLYFHLPFCNTICYYCACNKDHYQRPRPLRQVRQIPDPRNGNANALLGNDRRVEQLHWGGGTPTFLPDDQMRELMDATRQHFDLAPDGEYSIEIDPRKVGSETVALLENWDSTG